MISQASSMNGGAPDQGSTSTNIAKEKKTTSVDAYAETVKAKVALEAFLSKHKVKKGEASTHTSLAGGAYFIPDQDLDEFFKYYNDAFAKQVQLFLTEKPLPISNLRIDLDFRLKNEKERVHNAENVKLFIEKMIDYLKEYVSIDKIMIHIMEKPPRKEKSEHGYYKDGIHIVMPNLPVCHNVMYMLRDHMIPLLPEIFDLTKVSNTAEDIYDIAVIARNNWMLYGSMKREEQIPWKITTSYIADTNFSNEASFEKIESPNDDTLPKTLSMRYKKDHTMFNAFNANAKNDVKSYKNSDKQSVSEDSVVNGSKKPKAFYDINNMSLDVEKLEKLVEALSPDRAKNYGSWTLVVWGIYNIGVDLNMDPKKISELIHKFSKRCESVYKKKEVDNFIRTSVKYKCAGEGVHIGSLITYLQEDNPDAYRELFPKQIWELALKNCFIEGKLPSNADFVKIFYEHRKDKYLNSGSAFYKKSKYNIYTPLHKNVAEGYIIGKACPMLRAIFEKYYRQREAILKALIERFEQDKSMAPDKLKDEVENIESNIRKLKKQYYRVMDCVGNHRFMCSVFAHLNSSEHYQNRKAEEKFNTLHHLVPFKNGVYDLNEKKFRLPRDDEYISVTVGYDYMESHFQDVEAMIDSCMSDAETSRALKIYLGSILHACNKDEKVVFWVGSGGNGKSLIDTILRYTLGDFYMVLPASVYTNYEKDHNRASSVMAQLKNKRLAVCSETDESTKFVTANFTKTSGGDAISARHLRQDQEMFEPTHKSLIHTNYLPAFSSIVDALFRRIVVIWFRFQFKEKHMIDHNNPFHKLRDDSLKTKVKSYDYKLQMMNLMIHYYSIYEKEGLYYSQDILDANNAYKNDLQVLENWVRDRLEYAPGEKVPVFDVFELFKKSEACGEEFKFMAQKTFTSKLKQHFTIQTKRYQGSDGVSCFMNFILKPTPIQITEETEPVNGVRVESEADDIDP
jgi:P4 family phage/plasmid primase-like protien